jgi:MscS family membrane protein
MPTPMSHPPGRATSLVVLPVRALAATAALLLAGLAARPAAPSDAHPLEPPDTFSPRGTIGTLSRNLEEGWELFSAGRPGYRASLQVAASCLDVSGFPPEVATQLAQERAVVLKEILDRIELPPTDQIPGEAAVRERRLESWTVPHTEITLVRVAEGERRGEFLFSSRTVARLPEFFAKVRHLPYQPGKQGAHYDEIRSGALSPVLGSVAPRLPAWTRLESANHLLWQWLVVLVCALVAVEAGVLSLRLGRRWAAWERRAKGGHRLGPFLFPIVVIALARFLEAVLDRFIRAAGAPYYYGQLALTAIADLAAAWLIAVTLTRLGDLVIARSRAGERPINAQLVRLTTRLLTILVVTTFLFVRAESLGLPVPALIAGLGVGGLAVALATQGTLENLIGGLILYADQPVRVGELFRFGDKQGVVEEIGIRSARIRTLDRTVIAIPNAELVRMQVENFSRRDRIRIRAILRLRLETTPDQLRYLLTRLWEMVQAHPRLAHDDGRARFVEFGEWSFDLELVAFAETTDWAEFLAIREDVLLRVMTLVEEAGTRLAVPAQLELEGGDGRLDEERRREAEERVRNWRREGRPGVPASEDSR